MVAEDQAFVHKHVKLLLYYIIEKKGHSDNIIMEFS